MITIPMTVATSVTEIPVSVATDGVNLAVGLGAAYSVVEKEYYEGAYTFTPSDETQTIPTVDKVLREDIVINPVPSNYGRITYNGSAITVY